LPIEIGDNHKVIEIQQILKDELGVSVGAIRQPTVKKAILRVIFRLSIEEETVIKVCERLKQFWIK